MNELKTLANCTEVEFLRQTNRIRKAVEKWLTDTDIANIRKRLPEFEVMPKDADEETKMSINERNEALRLEQARKNLDAMLDSMLEDHPEETAEVIRLCCFVEPGEESKRISYYLGAFAEMFNDEDVLSFFQSLLKLAQTFGLTL